MAIAARVPVAKRISDGEKPRSDIVMLLGFLDEVAMPVERSYQWCLQFQLPDFRSPLALVRRFLLEPGSV